MDELPDEPALGYAQVAALLRVTASAVRKYRSDGRMPAPDWVVLDRPFWRKSTITAWQAARPGRGRRAPAAQPQIVPTAPADPPGAPVPLGPATGRTAALGPRGAATTAGRVVHIVDEAQASLPAWALCGVPVQRWVAHQQARDSRSLRYCGDCLRRSQQ